MKGLKKQIRDNRYLNWLLIVSNWLFQGILGADTTEKVFKILLSLIFSILIFFIAFQNTNIYTILISFLIGHTINWILSTNFYSLLTHRLLKYKNTKSMLFEYLYEQQKRITKLDWILYCAVFGSICKGDLKESSDLDISIVRKPGLKNAIKAMFFSIYEKKRADLSKIPVELWISDTPQDSINRFKKERNPVVIVDNDHAIDEFYNEKMSIKEAESLNKI